MNILGVSALYHDAAAALISNGEIVAAAQEERFSRVKHDPNLPKQAIQYCLKEARIESNDLDYVIFYDNSLLTLDRYMHNILALGNNCKDLLDRGYSSLFENKIWVHECLKKFIPSIGSKTKFLMTKHHISHAASAFYPSPFEEAMILTIDGVGEWATLAISIGKKNKINLLEEIQYPHSIGLLYSAFTYFCGFKVNSGDYKFMGLAPYGRPIYYKLLKEKVIDVKEDGSFQLNLEYFDFQNGRTMIREAKLAELIASFDTGGGGIVEPESQKQR